jgi:uncharacterized repeat protein (TIGR01451 family)
MSGTRGKDGSLPPGGKRARLLGAGIVAAALAGLALTAAAGSLFAQGGGARSTSVVRHDERVPVTGAPDAPAAKGNLSASAWKRVVAQAAPQKTGVAQAGNGRLVFTFGVDRKPSPPTATVTAAPVRTAHRPSAPAATAPRPSGEPAAAPSPVDPGAHAVRLLGGVKPCSGGFEAYTRFNSLTSTHGVACGKITITKHTQPGGGTGFAFTTTGDGLESFSLDDGGSRTFTGLVPGSYSVTEAAPAEPWLFDSLDQCTGSGGSSVQPNAQNPAQIDITLTAGGSVECTYVNKRKPQVKLVKDFEGTGTPVDLKLGDAVKGTFSGDGDTGFFTVEPGGYTASELFQQANGALYTTTSKCVKNGSDPGFADGLARDFTVANGDEVVCSFRNVHKTVEITTVKDFVGTPAQISIAAGPQSKSIAGDDQVSATVEVGTSQVLSETLAEAQKALYDTKVSCTGDQAVQAGVYSRQLAVGTGALTCTFVNTRKQGTLEIRKDFVSPVPDKQVELRLDDVAKATLSADGTTGALTVDTGSHTVSEVFSNAADGDLYTSAYSCTKNGQPYVASAPGRSVAVDVGKGDAVVCTLVNTRKPVTVTVTKAWLPESAKGAVTLRIGSTTQAFGAGDAQSLSASLDTGTTVTVGETIAPTGFVAFVDCTGDQLGEKAGLTLDVTVGDAPISCTVTNKRKPHVTVTKLVSPASDPGRFNLVVNGVVKEANARNDGTTGVVPVQVGDVTVAETAGTATSLDDYRAQISCGAKGDAAAGATTYTFAAGYGEDIQCTITNTRKTGTIEVVKVYRTPEGQPAPSPYASVALQVDGTTKATAPANLTTGAVQVNAGSRAVSEAFVQASQAHLYTSTGICKSGEQTVGSLSGDGRSVTGVTVGDGDHVVCTFTNTRKARSLEVKKTVSASPNGPFGTTASKPEPGGTFTFRVTVKNTSSADRVTVTGLDDLVEGIGEVQVDDLVCDVDDGGFPFRLDPGESVVCTFTRDVTGEPRSETDHVKVDWKDEEGKHQPDACSNDATVTITNVGPSIGVDKVVTGASSLQVPGGAFSYRVTITNTSLVEDVTITSLADFVDTDGSLNGTGTTGAAITMNGLDCKVPFVIVKGGSKVCTFSATVSGGAGTYLDVVVGTGADNEQGTTTADDDASVTLTPTPPPPPTVSSTPFIDIQVIKDATPQVQLGQDGKATITYTALVKNNGPNMANDVQLADPAPSGVVFGQVTKQPDFGSCQLTPALLTCNLGTMGYGVQTLISWTATVSVAGTIVNTATTTGTGGADRVPANNVDDAQTLVVAQVKPPDPKPKPKPKRRPTAKPVICATLTVTQKLVRADGSRQVLRATVRAKKKPIAGVRVRVEGPGLRLAARTNRHGVAKAVVKPKKAGIIRISVAGTKACNTRRIGVVGAFEPPVTG